MELESRILQLSSQNNVEGCAAMRELLALSQENDAVYPYWGEFLKLINHKSSYCRTRGLLLLCANAKWDREGQMDVHIPSLLEHITDEKPITSRQFIQALPQLAEAKPQWRERILHALETADLHGYGDSMRPLVEKDIQECVQKLR
ncbi:MAG: SufBD protein [Negativibacillus sp.]